MSRATLGRAVVALAAVGTLSVALVRGQAPPASADRAVEQTPGAPAGAALSLSGAPIAPTTVTLLTGDTATLNPAGTSGHYSVTASAAPRANGIAPPIQVTGQSKASGGLTGGVFAIPVDAGELVRQGTVDRGLFDLTYRAAHGLADGSLPVVLRYPAQDSSAQVAEQAQGLPASTYVSTVAGTHDAIVQVSLAQASTFWSALTTPAKVDPATPAGRAQVDQPFPALRLAGDVQGIWLQDHRLGVVAHPAVPMYDVAETITSPTDAAYWCTSQQPLCLTPPMFSMLGLTGSGAGVVYGPSSISCAEGSPCSSYLVHYSVPAGTYHVDGQAVFFRDDRWNNLEITNPQVTVAGPTSFGLDAGQAQQLVVDTPAPTESYSIAFMNSRALPDGDAFVSMTFNAYGYQAWWAIPTAPVSVGAFHLGQALLLGQAPVTMSATSATSPRSIALSAIYPMSTTYPEDPRGVIRFSGNRSLQLVYVNEGTPGDYTGQDTTGKLVLIRVRHFAGCKVYKDQIETAKQHGAAGVLIDPTDASQPSGNCIIPMYPSWWPPNDDGVPVDLPFAEIPPDQAHTLIALLGQSPVKVTVHGNGDTPYLYQTNTYQEGQVPASLHYSLGRDDLTTTHGAYHSDQAGTLDKLWGSWRADEWLSGGVSLTSRAAPTSTTEYAGPVTPDLVTLQTVAQTTAAGSALQQSLGTYGDAATTSWGSGPLAPGAVIADQSVLDAQPGKWGGLNAQGYCSACRQGDVLYPFVYLMDGSNPQAHNGPWAFTDTHLYSGSAEIASTPVNGLPAFTLPAAAARYRMTADGTGMHTEWHFTSSRPTTDQAPPASITCIGTFFGDQAPCQADPLVFLRYDAGLSLDNTLAAPGRHQLMVTAYHQDPAAPAITGLTLSVSVDGGSTWDRSTVRKVGAGRYVTTLALPSLAKTNGHLSLRAEATDAAGNDVTQTIDPAITLVSR